MAQAILGLAKTGNTKEKPNRNHYRCNWCLDYGGHRLKGHQKACSKCPVGESHKENM
ncbi:hypothetical protein DPMN_045219 [Dreissena polymorpha]|uniref:Uncharacterized protein n=1 Tax=Dreissena polymorpha TaxID=45954 RepID=A0A9D4I167_DREPO|nr:hypothetical protein DPMN_045219 [Dreissena polymorpha]